MAAAPPDPSPATPLLPAALETPHIVSLGVHILDVLVRKVIDIPQGQGISLVDEIRVTAAGTAAGTSVDLAKLGCRVTAIGAIGNDSVGATLLTLMSGHGVETRHLVKKVDVKTSATVLPIRPNGERPALHMLGANASFSFEDIPVEVLRNADYLHIGGTYLLPNFDGPGALKTLQLVKDGSLRTVVTSMDVLGMPRDDLASIVLPYMPYLDYFMPNLEEAEMITSRRGADLDGLVAISEVFLTAGVGTVVIKMGVQGSFVCSKDGSRIRVPAYKVEVVDTTGCGDGWSAGFLAAVSRGWPLEQAARFGSACGSLVASGLGSDAGIENWEQVLQFMETAEELPLVV